VVEISAHQKVSQGEFVMTKADVEVRHDARVTVVRKKGVRCQIEMASIHPPRPDDVIVRVVATGVCHTDMLVRDQDYPLPLPAVLGHEGSGIVEAVGSAVVGVGPGDHVVMTWSSCGKCRFCVQGHPTSCEKLFELNFGCARPDGSNAKLDQDGRTLHGHFFGQSSLSSFAVASERNVVKATKEVPIELLSPRGFGGEHVMIEFKGSHFERDVILCAVRWYVAYPISWVLSQNFQRAESAPKDWADLSHQRIELARWTQVSCLTQLTFTDHVRDLDTREGDCR
jgi:hypothetical protein